MREFTNWLVGFQEYNKESESSELYLLWTGMSILAAAAQRKIYTSWDTNVYPNMYIALIGPSGVARKGSAIRSARQMLEDLALPLAADSVTKARLLQHLYESESTVTYADGTAIPHSSITAISPELSVLMPSDDIRFMDTICDWYDCGDTWRGETKGAGSFPIKGLYVNILGATTPSTIQEIMLRNIKAGLASRFIFVYQSNRRQRTADPQFTASKEGREFYKRLLRDLSYISMLKGEFKRDKLYMDAYVDWYDNLPELCPFDKQHYQGYWSRKAAHLRKLSMLFSINEGDSLVLALRHFESALKLLDKTEEHMPKVFGDTGMSKYASLLKPILSEIYVAGDKGVTMGDLLFCYINDLNAFELKNIIDSFSQSGYIHVIKTSSGNDILKFNMNAKNIGSKLTPGS